MSPYTSNASREDIIRYAEDHEIDITVIIDEENVLYGLCNPSGYPTLFVTDPEGRFLGYAAGAMDAEGFDAVWETARSYQ